MTSCALAFVHKRHENALADRVGVRLAAPDGGRLSASRARTSITVAREKLSQPTNQIPKVGWVPLLLFPPLI